MSPLNELRPGACLPGDPPVAVVITLYGAYDHFARCLSSVLAHTPAAVPVLVADDHGPDPAGRALAEQLAGGDNRLHWLRQPENLGLVGNCNAAFAACGRADVCLVNSDVVVAAGWLDGLRGAACADDLIASASALANAASILSVPIRNTEGALPADTELDGAAARLRERSARLRPRIPTAVGHCMYLRRHALDLVGGFDAAFAPAYGEEVDWSQRATLQGFVHVAADDVLVHHHGRGSLGVDGARNPLQDDHERLVERRYPYYRDAVVEAESSRDTPLARAVALARCELTELSVTVDARSLGPELTGTQVHALELVNALAQRPGLRVRALLPDNLGGYAGRLLAELPQVERLTVAAALAEPAPARTDVVHRPCQVNDPGDLAVLRRLGERMVVTHQDLIAYRNPGYHATGKDWLAHRALTRVALEAADAVVFESEHARRDAGAEDLAGEHGVVLPIGVDHRLAEARSEAPAAAPRGGAWLDDERPFLLCVGTDFRHKNRLFALRLLECLRERHGWDGRLVLAGSRVRHGSSAAEEAAFLAPRPQLATAVLVLPAISESEKRWLYARATAALYPSMYEGFGLIPFEAAHHGIPCLWAPVTAMAETLAGVEAPLVAWDVAASAQRVHALLTHPARADALVAALRAAAAPLTWGVHAERLHGLYGDVVAGPARAAAHLAQDLLECEAQRGEYEGRYWHLRDALGSLALALVGPDGRLDERSQRALAALTARPATARPLLAGLRIVHRVGTRGRSSR